MVRRSGSKRYAIRGDPRKLFPYSVRIKARDWFPQEQILGSFSTPEEGFECADRALTSRWLRLGSNTALKVNEPDKLDRYIREEAAKLYREPVRRVPEYWFMEQAAFEPLLDELLAAADAETGSLVAAGAA